MTTTWATRLAADMGHDLRLYATVEGVPHVFQEDDTDVPAALESSARPRCKLIRMLDQGESRLDLQKRRMVGGGLTIEMQDDDDGTLRKLFSPRRFRRTYLTSDETTSSTTWGVASIAWIATYEANGGIVADTLYCDNESITYGGAAALSLTGVGRGAWGSEEQKHYGTATDGSAIFVSPPFWVGRRVTLTGYFLEKDGTTSANLSTTLGKFRIESSPRYVGNDVWVIECSELSDEFAVRKICTGVVDVSPRSRIVDQYSTPGTLALEVGTDDRFDQFAQSATIPTYVLMKKTAGGYSLRQIAAVSSPYVILYGQGAGQFVTNVEQGSEVDSVRHFAMLTDPIKDALRVLTSRLGDVTNGSYDELPGNDRTAINGAEWRFGAGIRSTEVDEHSFEAISLGATGWSYPLVEEESVEEFLSDWCLRFGCFWFVDRSGMLSVARLADASGQSALTIDSDLVVTEKGFSVEYDEDAITPRLSLECNYDALARKFMTKMNVLDVELAARYRNRDDRQSLRSKSLVIESTSQSENGQVITLRPEVQRTEVESLVGRQLHSSGRGRLYVSCVCHLPVLAVELGDLVAFSIDVPNLEGDASLSGALCRVVGMRPRYDDAEVDVRLEVIEQTYRIAPAAIIQSAAGAVLTLRPYSSTYPEASGASNASAMFRDGDDWNVLVHDVSGATSESHTVTSRSGNDITLSGVPGFVIAGDIDFVSLDYVGQGTGSSANGYAYSDFIFMMPDDEGDYDHDGFDVTRWR